MSIAIAVFCKTPGFSPIKTRLGADIGVEHAEEFYRLSVTAIEEVLLSVKKHFGKQVDVYWALAEQDAFDHPMWLSFSRVWTGAGELGDRIHHVLSELAETHDQVIILGSDSPQITKNYLIDAIERLSRDIIDGIIGPCRDGGFVLFGCKKLISQSVWTEVKYSQSDTLIQLMLKLEKDGVSYKIINSLGDVDVYDDLIHLLIDFIQMGNTLSAKQKYLFQWIQRILESKSFFREQTDLKIVK